jgi:hypothetical protein
VYLYLYPILWTSLFACVPSYPKQDEGCRQDLVDPVSDCRKIALR